MKRKRLFAMLDNSMVSLRPPTRAPRYALWTLLLGASVAYGGPKPIDVNGFNRDVVVEASSSGPGYYTAENFDHILDNNALYEAGLLDTSTGLPYPGGLPQDRKIFVPQESIEFELQPYDTANALGLRYEGPRNGVLALNSNAVGQYDSIAVLAASGNTFGYATFPMEIHFSDGSSLSTQINAHDWFAVNDRVAIQGLGRVNLNTGNVTGLPDDPRLYYTVIQLSGAERAKTLTSVEFGYAGGYLNVMAVSGEKVSIGGCNYSIVLPPGGYSMVANHCDHPSGVNRLANIMPVAPEGCTVMLLQQPFNPCDGAAPFTTNSIFSHGVWSDPNVVINPGEGAMVYNPEHQPFTLTFNGVPHPQVGPTALAAGTFLLSRKTPVDSTIDQIVDSAQQGDLLYYFNGRSGFDPFAYEHGDWDSPPPTIRVGESVLYLRPATNCCSLVVTSSADSGPGSLRAAIECANKNRGRDRITFKLPGFGPHAIQLLSTLPAITDPVIVDGYSQPGSFPNSQSGFAGLNGHLEVEIDGSLCPTNSDGLVVSGGNSEIRGLAINGFNKGGAGVRFRSSGNLLAGCHLGADPSGMVAKPNDYGIVVEAAPGNQVGGSSPEMRNLLSGNVYCGVFITGSGATANQIQANYIGVDVTGDAALPNGTLIGNGAGVMIQRGADSNLIGGTGAEGNLIAGNKNSQVVVDSSESNRIAGNSIGMSRSGPRLDNGTWAGIHLQSTRTHVVGNLVADTAYGIVVAHRSKDVVIVGNTIGTNGAGNHVWGIFLDAGSSGTRVGGTNIADGNIIAFNGGNGVHVADTVVSRDENGAVVSVLPASFNNAILGNSIHNNTYLGIDLASTNDLAGVRATANDSLDNDEGPNRLQNRPQLTKVEIMGGSLYIHGRLQSAPSSDYRIEIFANQVSDPSGYGEGDSLVHVTNVTTDGNGEGRFDVVLPAPGFSLSYTATATESAGGNTSEFSRAVVASECIGSASGGMFATDFERGHSPKMQLRGSAKHSSGMGVGGTAGIVLTQAQPGEFGAMVVPSPAGQQPVNGFKASFDLYMGDGSTPPADGFSFNFAPQLPAGALGEEGAGNGITVSFDTYDNGNGEAPAIDVKWQGVVISHLPWSLKHGVWTPVVIELHPGGLIDVDYDGETVLRGVVLPYQPFAGEFGFGARTGAAFDRQVVDNLCLELTLGAGPCLDFEPMALGLKPNPWFINGATLTAFADDQTGALSSNVEIGMAGTPFVGVVVGPKLVIDLPAPSDRVELTLGVYGDTELAALDASGQVVQSLTLSAINGKTIQVLSGSGITEVVILSRSETVLLALCFPSGGASSPVITITEPTLPVRWLPVQNKFQGAVKPTFKLAWPVTSGRSYSVLHKDGLSDQAWKSLGSFKAGQSGEGEFMDVPSGSQRFYIVVEQPAQAD